MKNKIIMEEIQPYSNNKIVNKEIIDRKTKSRHRQQTGKKVYSGNIQENKSI
jgi:hypothetical protein